MSRLARLALVASGAGLIASPVLHAAAPSKKADMEQEYIQVRKIALKDAKVQAAFDRANEKLNERILEIDPSLKPYVEEHGRIAVASTPEPVKKTGSTPGKSKAPVSSPQTAHTHIVTKGETLSSIAGHYNVSVSSLKSANGISDERKLRVGQKLMIPASKKGGVSETKSTGGLWDRLKSSF